jgi:hypothetical protein
MVIREIEQACNQCWHLLLDLLRCLVTIIVNDETLLAVFVLQKLAL